MRARVLALALAQFVEHDRLTKNTRIVTLCNPLLWEWGYQFIAPPLTFFQLVFFKKRFKQLHLHTPKLDVARSLVVTKGGCNAPQETTPRLW